MRDVNANSWNLFVSSIPTQPNRSHKHEANNTAELQNTCSIQHTIETSSSKKEQIAVNTL